MSGDLIGINTAIFSRTGGSEGIGFAIPSTIAMDVTDALMKTGKVVRGWLGIAIQEITPALAKSFKLPEQRKTGVLISDVNEDGPSHQAGLKRGDVIIGFDDREVKNVSQLRNMVARTLVGRQAKLKVLREGKEQFLNVKVGERPTDEMLAKKEPTPQTPQETVKPPDNVLASLRVQTLDAATMSQLNLPGKTSGVLINHVEPGSPAEAAGLQRGDVIQEVNHEVIKSLDDYQKMSAKI
jgi:serine protease Do